MPEPTQLRPFQREALHALEHPGHVLCVAPTGAGKSLIYERAAARPGARTLLVTPLIALARQQASRLRELGLPTHVGTGDPRDPPPRGRSGVWIVSPEALQSPSALATLAGWRPELLVVDECHCLWDWGDGFRPAFSLLPELVSRYGIPRSLWLTATLPRAARAELRRRLPSPVTELGAFGLPRSLELHFVRAPWVERAELLLALLRSRALAGPGILFASTRQSTLRLTRLIAAAGRSAMMYHAGLGSEERRATEKLVSHADADVIVATSAFGMGMNHPHLRWVVLWQAPASPLALAQAIGRAGRDPLARALAVTLWDDEDFRLWEWTLGASQRRRDDLNATYRLFQEGGCRSRALARYFDGEHSGSGNCGCCDACGRLLDALHTPEG